MVGKRAINLLISISESSTLILVMYEFGSSLPAAGDKIKKKFGEKLCHSISLKLVTDTLNSLPPAEKISSSPISRFIDAAISRSIDTSATSSPLVHHSPSTKVLLGGKRFRQVKLASLSMRLSKLISSDPGRLADKSLPRIKGVKSGVIFA